GQTVTVSWRTIGIQAPTGYYSGAVLADSPFSYYRLGEAAGATTAIDATSNHRNGTYQTGAQGGGVGFSTFDADTAATFDGSPGSVSLPSSTDSFSAGFSAEVWAYPTAVKNNAHFFELARNTSRDIVTLYRSGTSNDLVFQVYNDSFTAGPTVV